MPIYEYQCSECGKKHEKLYLNNDKITSSIGCDKCGGLANKIISTDFTINSKDPATNSEDLAKYLD